MLDDHLWMAEVCDRIRRWSTAQFLRDIRPGEVIKDERVPSLLRALRMPAFVTIDRRFGDRALRDRRYCILLFELSTNEQGEIPALLRQLMRLPEFRTRVARMGKIARVSRDHVSWWQIGDEVEHSWRWGSRSRRGAGR